MAWRRLIKIKDWRWGQCNNGRIIIRAACAAIRAVTGRIIVGGINNIAKT